MRYLSVIALEWTEFLKDDSIFKDFQFDVRVEDGTDESSHGINIYELEYDTGDGQAQEFITLLIEYYEKYNNVSGNIQNQGRIKERAKRFYNWVNSKYTKTYKYGDLKTTVGDIRKKISHGFFRDDKNNVGFAFELEIMKRNEIEMELDEEYPDRYNADCTD